MRSVAEHKNHDSVFKKDGTDASASPYVTASGVILDVSTIFIGSSDNARVGDKVTLTSIEVKHQAYPNLNIAQAEIYSYRLTIFIWKDDTTPQLSDIYDTSGGFTGTATYLTSLYPLNHDLKVKRKILYDKSFSCLCDIQNNTQLVNTENGHTIQNIIIPMTKLKNRLNEIHYNNATSNGVNKVYILLSNNLAATIVPAINLPFNHFLSCRLNYTDV